MDDRKRPQQQAAPTQEVTKHKRRFAPVLTIYGNLHAITTAVGVTSVKDAGSGMKNVRSQP
jgi:hypothetical protein